MEFPAILQDLQDFGYTMQDFGYTFSLLHIIFVRKENNDLFTLLERQKTYETTKNLFPLPYGSNVGNRLWRRQQ